MATTESYVLKDGQLVPEEQETSPITTRTNVSQIPKLDIQFKPIVTDNVGNNVQSQANADIDWNQNQNIINIGGFRGFRKRRALRDALNANKNNLIWNGNGFQRVNTGLGADRWSRRDVRRLMRSYNDNWSTIDNTAPEEGNNTNYAAYLSQNYLDNNPTATSFRWIAGKYPQKTVEEQDNLLQTNTVQKPINEPSFYGEMRNNLYDLTESANKEIFGSDGKKRDVASEFFANERAYENTINKAKQRQLILQEYSTKAHQDGFETSEKVKEFQRMNGLPVDGIYGPQTQAMFAQYNPVYENENYNPNNIEYSNLMGKQQEQEKNQTFVMPENQKWISKKDLHDYYLNNVNPKFNVDEFYQWTKDNGLSLDWFLPRYKQEKINVQNGGGIRKNGGLISNFQQGGTMNTQQQDKEEQLLQYALFSIIGANNDIDLNTAVSAIAEAYIKDPSSLTQVIQDENTIKLGMQKLEQENPGSVKQITQPGFMKKVITNLISDIQQRVKQAKMGTKLDYIKQLKNICPEGYEIEFRKAGGSVCPVCKKKHKAQKAEQGEKIEKDCGGGISKTMNSIKKAMKCGGKVKKEQKGGEAIKSPKQKAFEERDSLIQRMNQNPNEGTADSLTVANRKVGKYLDSAEADTTGPRLNDKAIEFMKKRKLKQVPIRTQK